MEDLSTISGDIRATNISNCVCYVREKCLEYIREVIYESHNKKKIL